MPDTPKEQQIVDLTLYLDGADDSPARAANHFVIQQNDDEFFLTISQICPPVLLGDEQAVMRQLTERGKIRGHVLGRFVLSRKRLGELSGLLQRYIEQYDAKLDRGKPDVH